MTTSQQDGTMIDRMAQFDLLKEIADSEQKKPWQSGHNARTLFKKHDFRIVLITMEDAARMKQHHADGTISILNSNGSVDVTVDVEGWYATSSGGADNSRQSTRSVLRCVSGIGSRSIARFTS